MILIMQRDELNIFPPQFPKPLNRWSNNLERMSFSIKYPFINPIMFNLPNIILVSISTCLSVQHHTILKEKRTHRRMNQITILQHLRKQETILKILKPASPRLIHIIQLRKAAPSSRRPINRHKRIPRPIPILLIPCRSVRIIEALDNLRTKDVIGGRDVEPRFFVERSLVRWGRRVGSIIERGVRLDPAEGFRADAGDGGGVRVFAAVDEEETEVDVFLLFEDEAAEDEVSAVETGDWSCKHWLSSRLGCERLTMLRLVDEFLPVVDR
jgi:hypothetical protein